MHGYIQKAWREICPGICCLSVHTEHKNTNPVWQMLLFKQKENISFVYDWARHFHRCMTWSGKAMETRPCLADLPFKFAVHWVHTSEQISVLAFPISLHAWTRKLTVSCWKNLQTSYFTMYKRKSIIIHNAVVFVFLLAALLCCAASLCVVSVLILLRRFDVARSVPLLLPCH
jgi:hypothetical protein